MTMTQTITQELRDPLPPQTSATEEDTESMVEDEVLEETVVEVDDSGAREASDRDASARDASDQNSEATPTRVQHSAVPQFFKTPTAANTFSAHHVHNKFNAVRIPAGVNIGTIHASVPNVTETAILAPYIAKNHIARNTTGSSVGQIYSTASNYGGSIYGGNTSTAIQRSASAYHLGGQLSTQFSGALSHGGYYEQGDSVRIEEVPVYHEKIVRVPKKQYVEIERKIPRVEVQWVDRVVEVPEIRYNYKEVAVPIVQEVTQYKPVREVVEVAKEVVRYVPIIEYKTIEKEVEVPGEIIEVPKPYLVENKIIKASFTDKEVPTVVSQKFKPIITESTEDFVDAEMIEYVPCLIPVDVYIPKPVERTGIATQYYTEHNITKIPAAHFNAISLALNERITNEEDLRAVLKANPDGKIEILDRIQNFITSEIVQPLSDEWEAEYTEGIAHTGKYVMSQAEQQSMLQALQAAMDTSAYSQLSQSYVQQNIGLSNIQTGGYITQGGDRLFNTVSSLNTGNYLPPGYQTQNSGLDRLVNTTQSAFTVPAGFSTSGYQTQNSGLSAYNVPAGFHNTMSSTGYHTQNSGLDKLVNTTQSVHNVPAGYHTDRLANTVPSAGYNMQSSVQMSSTSPRLNFPVTAPLVHTGSPFTHGAAAMHTA